MLKDEILPSECYYLIIKLIYLVNYSGSPLSGESNPVGRGERPDV